MDTLYTTLLEQVRSRRTKGVHRNCLADRILDEQDTVWQFNEVELKNLFGILLEGGSDTVRFHDIAEPMHLTDATLYRPLARSY